MAYFSCILSALLLGACESEESFTFDGTALHGPLSMALVPGQNLALVVSTNFDFSNSVSSPQDPGGAISVVDLNSMQLLTDLTVQIPNFGGQLAVDSGNNRLFLADRDQDRLRTYTYAAPGPNGERIVLTAEHVIETGEDPFATLFVSPTGAAFAKLYTANIKDSEINLFNANTLSTIDLDPNDSDSETLKLNEVNLGSINYSGQVVRPNRFAPFGSEDLYLLSTTTSGLLFVIDTKNDAFEALLDLQPLVAIPSVHGIAVTPAKLAFVASQGAKGILVLDLSNLSDNGVDNEVIIPPVVQTIPTGSNIEALLLASSGTKIYAANFSRNSVLVIDAVSGAILKEIPVGQGPTELLLNDTGSQLLVSNFMSDSISVIDTTTDAVTNTVE